MTPNELLIRLRDATSREPELEVELWNLFVIGDAPSVYDCPNFMDDYAAARELVRLHDSTCHTSVDEPGRDGRCWASILTDPDDIAKLRIASGYSVAHALCVALLKVLVEPDQELRATMGAVD